MSKLVLFDFDGTLADTAPDMAVAANRLRERQGLPPLPFEALRGVTSQGARGFLRASLGIEPDHPDYEAHRQQFLADYAEHLTVLTRLFPGVPELLQALKTQGFRWGIVTNKVEYLALPIVRFLGLDDECAITVGGDTAGHPKPHPAPLFYAAEKTGFLPDQCIYIGDDERDILAGKAAGMPTIAAAYGYCEPAHAASWQADAVAHQVDELFDHIVRLV